MEDSTVHKPVQVVQWNPRIDNKPNRNILFAGLVVVVVIAIAAYLLFVPSTQQSSQNGTASSPYNPGKGYSGPGYYNISGQSVYISSQSQLNSILSGKTTTTQLTTSETTTVTTTQTTTTTTIPNSNASQAGRPITIPEPNFSCPLITSTSNITLQSMKGFEIYNKTNYTDLVLLPGSTAVINYSITGISSKSNFNTTFYNSMYLYYPENGIWTNITWANDTADGLTITYNPQNYTIPANSTINGTRYFQITINAGINASLNTYLAQIDLCEGLVSSSKILQYPILITVGQKPYNSTVNSSGFVWS